MPSRSCRPRGQPVRVCAASSDAPAQGDARRAPLHAQALRRRESAAAIQARRYAPEKKQACEVRAYGNAAVAAAAATEATCALDIVVTRRCRAHLCVPRGNPEARGGLCQCHRGKPGWGSFGQKTPCFRMSIPGISDGSMRARPRARPGHGGPGGHRERAGAAPTVHSLPLRDEKRLLAVVRGRGWWRKRVPRLTLS